VGPESHGDRIETLLKALPAARGEYDSSLPIGGSVTGRPGAAWPSLLPSHSQALAGDGGAAPSRQDLMGWQCLTVEHTIKIPIPEAIAVARTAST